VDDRSSLASSSYKKYNSFHAFDKLIPSFYDKFAQKYLTVKQVKYHRMRVQYQSRELQPIACKELQAIACKPQVFIETLLHFLHMD